MIIFIIIVICFIIFTFVIIDQDLRVLKRKDLHQAIQYSRFMRITDWIFNSFFEWSRWKKIMPIAFLALLLLAFSAYLFIRYTMPKAPPLEQITVNHGDSAVLARGAYLANHVAICTDCHSARDANFFSWPVIKGQEGSGGPFLSKKAGFDFPGESFTPNITPANIGKWSDAELYRTITTGILPDGKTLYHAMPFEYFAKADPEDIKAIIAYLRTLQPINNQPAGVTEIDFLASLRSRLIPRKTEPVYLKDLKNAVDSGRYLVNLASCTDCHTPNTWADFKDETRYLSGGLEFPMPAGGFVHSANLTPDESGLAVWTEESFVNKFKSYRDSAALYKMEPNTLNSLMPWFAFSNMTDQDLKNIYAYLKTLTPVFNPVVKFTNERIERKKSR